MEFLVLAGVVALIVVGVLVIAAALRAMRPKEPEPQTYTAPVVTARTASTTAVPQGSGLTREAVAEIDRLIAAGQKIHAIKVYRDRTGVGLKEAKDRIDHWSVSSTAPYAAVSHAAAPHSAVAGAVRASIPPAAAAEIDRLVLAGQKITAIKLLREHTGLGLKESKDQIEAWVPRSR